MGYNPVAPQDRATAQLMIVMSSLVLAGCIAGLLFMDLAATTRLGIPVWVLMSAVILFGVIGLVNGIRMWRKNGASVPCASSDAASVPVESSRPARVSRALPAISFTVFAAFGVLGFVGGTVTLIVGILRNDTNAISIGVLVGGGGFMGALIGLSSAAYFRSVNRPDRQ